MPTIQEWNWFTLMLVQAMIGQLSANIRMISLRFDSKFWIVDAILYDDSDSDCESLKDVVDDTSIYIEDIKNEISEAVFKPIILKISIHRNPIVLMNEENIRVVFMRKE